MRFRRVMRKYTRITVDSSVFIYQFEDHPQFAPLCSIIFRGVSTGSIHLITSTVTVSEVLVHPFQEKRIDIIERYEDVFLSLPHFTLKQIDYAAAKLASYLRAEYDILLPDALQIAVGLRNNADVFVTNDAELKRVNDLPIICLKDY